MKNIQRTVCDPNCHADPKCGINATVEDDKIIAVTGSEYPLEGFKNRICMMGLIHCLAGLAYVPGVA